MALVHRGSVNAWECDERGHMNVQFFAGRSSDAGYALARLLGLVPGATSFAILQHHIRYHRELMAGDLLSIDAAVLEMRGKTLRAVQHFREDVSGALAATFVLDAGHLDLTTRRLTPWSAETQAHAAALAGAADPLSSPKGLPPDACDSAPTRAKAQAGGMALTNVSAVNSWETDSNRHLNVRGYVARFSECQSHLWALAGLPRPAQARAGLGTATTEHRIAYLKELREGDVVEIFTGIVARSARSVHFRHWMFVAGTDTAAAAADGIAVVFDKATRKAMPLDAAIAQAQLQR